MLFEKDARKGVKPTVVGRLVNAHVHARTTPHLFFFLSGVVHTSGPAAAWVEVPYFETPATFWCPLRASTLDRIRMPGLLAEVLSSRREQCASREQGAAVRPEAGNSKILMATFDPVSKP